MPFFDKIPPGALPCHYVEQPDLVGGLEGHARFCEFYQPANYFFITGRPDAFTIEGWLGRPECNPSYFEKIHSNLTFFQDYEKRKPVCFTFDKTTLYKVVTILPERPLKFILQQVQDFSKLWSMINQEEIYQLIHKKQWDAILNILYKHKTRIADDALLQQSARIFESEFQKAIVDHPVEDTAFTNIMEKLYLLHAGRFFILEPACHKLLSVQLAKRKEGNDAVNYAMEYPDEPEVQEIIAQRQSINEKKIHSAAKPISEREWLEIYNRLFPLINDKDNSETYFSGPRFVTAVQEFVPYFTDYNQYIDLRNKEGKSTSRKIFYYDILMEHAEPIRIQIVQRILLQVQRSHPEEVQAIEMLLGLKAPQQAIISKTKADDVPAGTPIVFISYSWDDDEHSAWVLKLAGLLRENGIDVILDKYELKAGKHLIHFMEQAIKRSNKIIIIFTPNYKLKAENRKGGVGYEYSIMNVGLYENQTENEKIIPILRKGSQKESIPEFMRQFIHLDFTNDEKFETSCTDLLREIFDEPAIKKPKLGSRPTFQ